MPLVDPQAPLGPGVPPRPVTTPSNGRPRALDDASKRSIAMLVAEGYSLDEAAAYMACDPKAIDDERRRDEHFDYNLRRAFTMRNMEPLNTVRCAAKSNWRAASWLLMYRGKVEKEKLEGNHVSYDRLELTADRPHGALDGALNGGDQIPVAAHAKTVAESLAEPQPIPEAVAVAAAEVVETIAEPIAEPITEPITEPTSEPTPVEPQLAIRHPQLTTLPPAVRPFSPIAREPRVDAIMAALEAELQTQARRRLKAAERLLERPDVFPHAGKKSAVVSAAPQLRFMS